MKSVGTYIQVDIQGKFIYPHFVSTHDGTTQIHLSITMPLQT